jgi:hypothetical protein
MIALRKVARTVNSESAVVFGIPVLVLLSRARSNDVPRVLHRQVCKSVRYG